MCLGVCCVFVGFGFILLIWIWFVYGGICLIDCVLRYVATCGDFVISVWLCWFDLLGVVLWFGCLICLFITGLLY